MVDLKLYVGMCYDDGATTRLDAIMTKMILMVSMCVSNLEDVCNPVFIPFTNLTKLALASWYLGVQLSCGV